MTKDDWRQYLVKRSIHFSEDELRYFFNHNNFGSEITLNEFLESMIPYNADVVREFKAKYLDSLEIREFDPEV